MSARAKSRLSRWFVLLFAAYDGLRGRAGHAGQPRSTPRSAASAKRCGSSSRALVADVTVHDIMPSDVPPGFGYPPRAPRYQVYRANVTVHAVEMPAPYAMGLSFSFKGVTPTGDAYEPRNSDAPDALQYAMHELPAGCDRQRRACGGTAIATWCPMWCWSTR